MQNNFQEHQTPIWYDNFLDTLGVLSFIIGVKNLELNVTANDLEKASSAIVDKLNEHLQAQDEHLKSQDEHLRTQDEHLKEQDRRFDHIEAMLSEVLYNRKEND